MIWDYLHQFWDLLVAVNVGSVEYPILFFQQIGLAVAGALGQFFDVIFHNINDVFVLFAWIGGAFKNIFLSLLSPITYFFNILRFFFASAFGSPAQAEVSYTFSAEILEVFNSIPNWTTISLVLGAVVLFVCGVGMLRLLLRT